MSNPQIPKAIQDDVMTLQNLEENIQALSQQSRAIDVIIMEKNKAIEELSEMEDDAVVYKIIGNVLIKSEKATVLDGLKEDITDSEMHKKRMERQLDTFKKKYEEIKKRVQEKYEKMRPS
ncbi:MAG: prefoldin subunit beta [Promethearchaeota archaeon]|nr:MAG: prefoldin subunit beta [Candidatus Lokiarchaeota archaeon]